MSTFATNIHIVFTCVCVWVGIGVCVSTPAAAGSSPSSTSPLTSSSAPFLVAVKGATPGAPPASGSASNPASASELDQRIAAEPPANSPEEIADRGAFDFVSAPGLSSEQKQKIMVIYSRTYQEAMAIRSEIGKAKSLLFKTVATKAFASGDVERLKARIVELDKKRLDVMFKALEDVQKVIGTGKDKEEIYKHFHDNEYPKHQRASLSSSSSSIFKADD